MAGSERKVAIRFGTEGRAQVVADLEAMGNAGDAAAGRLKRAFERDTADAEASLQRLARTQEKIATLMPGLNPAKLDMYAGVNEGVRKSAEQSASVFGAYYKQMEDRAHALVLAIDPVARAQDRFNREIEEARGLVSAGVLSLDQYVAKLRFEQQALDAASAGHQRSGVSAGQSRAAMQQLGFQMNDVATQFASGTSASIIFAQQSGQVIQALQMMAGPSGGGAVLRFLASWQGAVVAAIAIAAIPFIAKLVEGSNELDKEADKLRKNADQTHAAELAKKAFAVTEAGAVADVRALTAEIEKQNLALFTNSERMNIRAKQDLETLNRERANRVRDLAKARTDLERANDSPEAGLAGTAAASKVAALEARLRTIDQSIRNANAALLRSRADLADESAQRVTDPIAKIKREYEGPDGLIEQAKRRAVAEGVVGAALTRQLATLREQEQSRIKGAQEAGRVRNNNAIGRDLSLSEAEAIVNRLGGRVTSAQRSTAIQARLYRDMLAGRHDGPVAKPGTSAHERGNALDVAFGPGISIATLKQAFAEEGARITKIFAEPGQRVFHLEFAQTAADKAAIREAAQAAKDLAKLVGDIRSFDVADSDTAARERVSKLAAAMRLPDQLAAFRTDSLSGGALEKTEAEHGWWAVRDEALAEEKNRREEGIRSAASLYRDLMTGGVNSIWDRFRQRGLDALAELLAKWTVGSGSGGGSLLKLLGLAGSAASAAGGFKLNLPDRVTPAEIPHNAAGTHYWSGGASLVGEDGPETVWMPRGSRVTPAGETRRLLAGNDNAPAPVNHFHLEGAVVTQDLLDQMNAIGDGAAVRGASGGAAIGGAQMRARQARKLGRFR